ncbi:MAG: DegT/DnrJ/EryC1/StrS family aminotransferase [Deltaproteobacteria bacterium]|jgi:dTDP-4-amino-4,6-dideoxygalactose transaminase|nr:DegT/DnrJ/EryC1/StrS family aminotransferase [Deltaproteobacteria bacterium]
MASSLAFIDLKKQYNEIKDDLAQRLHKVIDSCAFIQGPYVAELEEALANYVGVPHAITCANGTDALTLPLLALELKPLDAVFCPTFTFIATAEVISLRGAAPVFVDVDPVTFNMCPKDLEQKIVLLRESGQYIPKGIICVDLFGLPADYPAIEAIAKKYNLFILEDAAQGFGSRIGEKIAGSFGQVAGTSFFPAKPLGCYGDGGAVFTSDGELAKVLRSLKSHGQGKDKYEHQRVGMNSRLDTLQAGVLLAKLKVFPQELQLRQKAASLYNERLADIVEVPSIPPGYLSAYAQYTVKLKRGQRDRVQAQLKDQGIPTMVYYPKPLHKQPAYAYGAARVGECPIAENLSEVVLSLPMHPYLEESDIDRVTDALKAAIKG